MTHFQTVDHADNNPHALRPGDTVAMDPYNGISRTIVVTQEGLNCDCGKGVLCPYNPQPLTSLVQSRGGLVIATKASLRHALEARIAAQA